MSTNHHLGFRQELSYCHEGIDMQNKNILLKTYEKSNFIAHFKKSSHLPLAKVKGVSRH